MTFHFSARSNGYSMIYSTKQTIFLVGLMATHRHTPKKTHLVFRCPSLKCVLDSAPHIREKNGTEREREREGEKSTQNTIQQMCMQPQGK